MPGNMISKRRESFSESAVDDEIVLMQIDTGAFFSLQGTGRTIWQLIDAAPGYEAMLDDLAQRFDAPRQTLAADLDEFLHMLAQAGFVARH